MPRFLNPKLLDEVRVPSKKDTLENNARWKPKVPLVTPLLVFEMERSHGD